MLIIRCLVLAATLGPLSGCFVVRGQVDRPLADEQIAKIERGVTTKKQILDLFGPPQSIDAREIVAVGDLLGLPGDNRDVEQLVAARYFRYEFVRANGAAVILLVFNYVDADVKRDSLVIFFDGKDVVEDFAFARDTDKLPAMGPLSR